MYVEHPSRLAGAVRWSRTATAQLAPYRVLPDGCLDIIWIDGELLVAGPDAVAQVSAAVPGARYLGLRFAPGTGARVLGVPAYELRGARIPLAQLWPAATVRRIAEATDPVTVVEQLAVTRLADPDPVVGEVARRAAAGAPVAAIATAVGLSERQLHRRCLPAFGYGAKTLARILRMRRALTLTRSGRPFAQVAAMTGYADQAHLSREVKALAGVPLSALIG